MNLRPRFFINRKTILADTKKIPTPTTFKQVFVTNGPGHTFNKIRSPKDSTSSSQFNQQAISEMINSLNLTCHKLWSAQQTFSNRKIIFQTSDIVIKVIGICIILLMIWVLLTGSGNEVLVRKQLFSKDFFLLVLIMLIWLTSVSLVIYIYVNRYKGFFLDEKIIAMIHHILAVYNDGILKELQYEAKCDEWATWISITNKAKNSNRVRFGEQIESQRYVCSQQTENLREVSGVNQ